MHGGNSNADSEEMFGEEFFEKEVRVSSRVGGARNGNSRGGKESRCEGGYTNMEGNIVRMRKEGIESMSNDVPMQQDNTHKWGETRWKTNNRGVANPMPRVVREPNSGNIHGSERRHG
ncbi:hypothetical protein ACSQ67_006436 [Phaseolus vulgaris]